MHHIIYLSRPTQHPSSLELEELLAYARSKNARAGITGALVYGGGQYMQVLEGEKTAITTLYERIIGDARHQTIVKLADKPIGERTFVDWSMAFRQVSSAQATALAGYVSPARWEQTYFASGSADALLLNHLRAVVLKDGSQ